MNHTFRNTSAAAALLTAVLAPASVTTQTPSPEWQIGDLFVGIGRFDDNPGAFSVYSPQGVLKEGLLDPSAATIRQKGMPIGTTTGCMIAPPGYGDAMYSTTFYGLRVMRFAASHPHASTLAAAISHPEVDSIESVVFDNQGNYYVSGLPPSRDRASDPVPPYAYIFKYRRVTGADVLQATYQVPNGMRGADWLDLGTDQQTFYYTSEGTKVHEFRPAGSAAGPVYREIQLHYPGGQAAAGTAYGLRALPPFPGDPTLRPSGFLVAMHSGILRVTYDGMIVHRYDLHGDKPGQYFALNIAPDGQSFWTATFQTDDPNLPAAGHLYKFHIATGALLKGPIAVHNASGVRARSVWGLCVKREYTAAMNACFDMNPDGAPKLDANGNGIEVVCRVPEICSSATGDDDRDGLLDSEDPDCTAPVIPPPVVDPPPVDPPQQGTLDCSAARPSVSTWPPNHKWVPVTVLGVNGADGSPASITITGILQDEPTDATGDGKTAIDGRGVGTSVADVRAERTGGPKKPGNGRVYEILFKAASGADSCTGSVLVGIPHDMGKGRAVDDGARYDSTIANGPRIR
jgi:hypothetical protein